MDQLDLLEWTPPRQVIPFPTEKRVGHARRVAELLDKARTNREADWALTRACRSLREQMKAAGIPADEIGRQHATFLKTIIAECDRIKAKWTPTLPDNPQCHGAPGGAA